MPPEEEAAPEAAKKKERSGAVKALLTLVVVFVVCGAAAVPFTILWLSPRLGSGPLGIKESEQTEAAEDERSSGAPIFYDPIELIVNIEEENVSMRIDRFLIVEISLQMESERLRVEIASIEPRIKDLFIGVLRSKTYEDLKGARGQDSLKRELVEKANALLETGRIVDASFTKFQIQ